MKASLLSLVPVVLGLSFSNVVLAEEAPAEAAPANDAPVAEEAAPAEPVLIEQPAVAAARPGPIAAPMPEAPAQMKEVGGVRSKPMIIVGSILSGLGAAGLIGGGVLWAQAEARDCGPSESDAFGIGAAFCGMGQGFDKMFAAGLLISGGIHTAVGIPLLAVGSQAPSAGKEEAPAPRADLQIGASGATFTMSF